jgi:hypothetical protein
MLHMNVVKSKSSIAHVTVGPTCRSHLFAVAGPVHACGSRGVRAVGAGNGAGTDRDAAPTWVCSCTENGEVWAPREVGTGVRAGQQHAYAGAQ